MRHHGMTHENHQGLLELYRAPDYRHVPGLHDLSRSWFGVEAVVRGFPSSAPRHVGWSCYVRQVKQQAMANRSANNYPADWHEFARKVSIEMMFILRHNTSVPPLASDTGGWVDLDVLSTHIRNRQRIIKHERDSTGALRIFMEIVGAAPDSTAVSNIIVAALGRNTGKKSRAQIMMEYFRDRQSGREVIIRTFAVRFSNGHTLQHQPILDSHRVAAPLEPAVIDHFPGFFHVTSRQHIASIIERGLIPGAALQDGARMDIHATTFSMTAPRGQATADEVRRLLNATARCAVVFFSTRSHVNNGRINLGDGVCLGDTTLFRNKISCIVEVAKNVTAAKGAHNEFLYELICDSQSATIPGIRVAAPHSAHKPFSTLTRSRLKEESFDPNDSSNRSSIEALPPTREEVGEWKIPGQTAEEVEKSLFRCPMCFACTLKAMPQCYYCITQFHVHLTWTENSDDEDEGENQESKDTGDGLAPDPAISSTTESSTTPNQQSSTSGSGANNPGGQPASSSGPGGDSPGGFSRQSAPSGITSARSASASSRASSTSSWVDVADVRTRQATFIEENQWNRRMEETMSTAARAIYRRNYLVTPRTQERTPTGHVWKKGCLLPCLMPNDGLTAIVANPHNDYQTLLEIVKKIASLSMSKTVKAMRIHLASVDRTNNKLTQSPTALIEQFSAPRRAHVESMPSHLSASALRNDDTPSRQQLAHWDPAFARAHIVSVEFKPPDNHTWDVRRPSATYWHGGQLELFSNIIGEGCFRSSTREQTKGGLSGVYCFPAEKAALAMGYAVGSPLFENQYIVHLLWKFRAPVDSK